MQSEYFFHTPIFFNLFLTSPNIVFLCVDLLDFFSAHVQLVLWGGCKGTVGH